MGMTTDGLSYWQAEIEGGKKHSHHILRVWIFRGRKPASAEAVSTV
jgi:hypothetical protein